MSTSREVTHKPGALQSTQLDYILIDGSQSMMNKWWDVLAALDGMMDVLKSQNIHSHGIVSVFDSYDLGAIQRDSLISEWKTFSDDPVGANWGDTPLYDAINNMARHLRDLDPPKCSILIATDGAENGSRYTDATQAKALLDWCRAKGWQVTFIGADFNNSMQAKALGASEENSIGVQRKLLGEAGKLYGQKRAAYGQSGDDINFSKDEKQQFGGYLADNSGGK